MRQRGVVPGRRVVVLAGHVPRLTGITAIFERVYKGMPNGGDVTGDFPNCCTHRLFGIAIVSRRAGPTGVCHYAELTTLWHKLVYRHNGGVHGIGEADSEP
jgi:hypothetical protein